MATFIDSLDSKNIENVLEKFWDNEHVLIKKFLRDKSLGILLTNRLLFRNQVLSYIKCTGKTPILNFDNYKHNQDLLTKVNAIIAKVTTSGLYLSDYFRSMPTKELERRLTVIYNAEFTGRYKSNNFTKYRSQVDSSLYESYLTHKSKVDKSLTPEGCKTELDELRGIVDYISVAKGSPWKFMYDNAVKYNDTMFEKEILYRAFILVSYPKSLDMFKVCTDRDLFGILKNHGKFTSDLETYSSALRDAYSRGPSELAKCLYESEINFKDLINSNPAEGATVRLATQRNIFLKCLELHGYTYLQALTLLDTGEHSLIAKRYIDKILKTGDTFNPYELEPPSEVGTYFYAMHYVDPDKVVKRSSLFSR